MNPAETDASLDVCGDKIGSCRFLFKIDGDSTLDTDQYTIERACNGNFHVFDAIIVTRIKMLTSQMMKNSKSSNGKK